ncbi:[FeFe] hydrogenase, group A [Treponema primitia]|uniref:HydA1 n=1 Tax=Treponema primitia ZAS-1 TaxID=717227 RepID=G8CQU1_9SPIR|nr:[FeFe] hydrogenase, group A [Treponema primitia]AEL20834.1 HydA1 [Treponema primitia ZAS-1]
MAVIQIDKDICTGCQECTKVCPVYAIEGNPGEAQTVVAERCVMCGQCVQKCKSYVSLIDHGPEMYNKKREERMLPETVREPLFAAHNVSHLAELIKVLDDPSLFTIVQAAPAVRVGIAEDFGLPLGSLASGKMAAGLRRLGFKKVYDTNFSADLTIMEEGTELVKRVTEKGVLPMFTSCCPGWVRYMENTHPELTKHLSSCKSPQQMAGAVFKTYGAKLDAVEGAKVYNVSVMPCTCKTFEAAREEMNSSGWQDIDVVITTRELGYLLKYKGIDLATMPDEEFDMPLGEYTGAGAIFGVTGGVMEAAIRTGYTLITGKELKDVDINAVRGNEGFRRAEIKAGDLTLKVGVVTNLKNIDPVIEQLQAGTLDAHFVEVMTCPEGCISGGGQPKLLSDTDTAEAYQSRRKATYDHDKALPKRKSHESGAIKKIYAEFLEKPNGHKSHELLHTSYKSE